MNSVIFRVILRPQAKRDLRKIWLKIARENLSAADRFLAKIDGRVLSLTEFPERGAVRNDVSDVSDGLRMLIEGNYLIFYRTKTRNVEILRVVYGSRDLTKLFG